ncbi:Hint domain-containing protein [Paracoccus sp. p3-h83]|uniref:Hint domain-containing protein n=1 Tax=Paracoccus sp. p3-h83 TaxID=3342805 RepID=UPI0035B737BD
MAAELSFSVISLGALPVIDPYEYNNDAEDAGLLVGRSFDRLTADNLQTFRPALSRTTFSDTADSGGAYDSYNQDSSYGADYFEIVAADGSVSVHRFDAVVSYRADVTFVDPQTRLLRSKSVQIGVIQDSIGNTWVVPPSTYSRDTALLDATITRIELTDVVESSFTGLHAWREQLPEMRTAPCFTAGTLIDTPQGPRLIETLVPGDLVLTCDHGAQPLRWIGRRHFTRDQLASLPHLRPIRISAGALGGGCPSRDLVVSPQHRVLVRSPIAQRMFSAPEVLVAARHLCALDGVDVLPCGAGVSYLHLMFDRHEVILSNGAATESLYPGPEALRALGPAARHEVLTIFPELGFPGACPQPARALIAGRKGRSLVRRHAANSRSLVE